MMKNVNQFVRVLAAVLIGVALISSLAHAQHQMTNPNNLPPCPAPNYTKHIDQERYAKWNKCWGDTGKYVGEFNNGEKTGYGYGEATFADGRYVGSFNNGERHGQGVTTFRNGDKYEGNYVKGLPDGYGTYTYANSNKYVGEFKEGKQEGQGRYKYSSGDLYVGFFKGNKFHGEGTYTKPDGTEQSGLWVNDVLKIKKRTLRLQKNLKTN